MPELIKTEEVINILDNLATKEVVKEVYKNNKEKVEIFQYRNLPSISKGVVEMAVSRFMGMERRIAFLNGIEGGTTIYLEHEVEKCLVTDLILSKEEPTTKVGYELTTGKVPLLIKTSGDEWVYINETPRALENGIELTIQQIVEKLNKGWVLTTVNKRGEVDNFSEKSSEVVVGVDNAEVVKMANTDDNAEELEVVIYRRPKGGWVITKRIAKWHNDLNSL